jgi:hypothetical protein
MDCRTDGSVGSGAGIGVGSGTFGFDRGRVHRMYELIDKDIGKRMVNIPQPLTFDYMQIPLMPTSSSEEHT